LFQIKDFLKKLNIEKYRPAAGDDNDEYVFHMLPLSLYVLSVYNYENGNVITIISLYTFTHFIC